MLAGEGLLITSTSYSTIPHLSFFLFLFFSFFLGEKAGEAGELSSTWIELFIGKLLYGPRLYSPPIVALRIVFRVVIKKLKLYKI